ncbi:hypothetical protein GCM10011517_33460 [Actibacterium pelagium]|uniref:Uncharacterized protein n=2 Tax=Actibacterium pelagium TaxID=2029103 RepID=A0A917APD5_9RHOB|nr:hypothetical protein [Actibacterium pelagium]GGE63089.1 hypothetical protein GCM10011517_33460 [Actibacterium pelagium]
MMTQIRNVLEIFGIVFLRFRYLARIWNVWLVGVNMGCLYFIQHVEAQVVLATTLIAVVGQGVIYNRIGFTRLLGITHIMWVPMFVWMGTRLEAIAAQPELATWLAVLLATNIGSMIIDATDVRRYFRGERAPHYAW